MNTVFIAIYPYTSESYETQVRTTGTSMNAMFARFTGIIMPSIIIQLYEINEGLPLLMFAVVAFLAFINTLCIPYDTRGIALDRYSQLENKDDVNDSVN
jgi:hypothetical protein